VVEILKSFDPNHDGKVSFEEFIAVFYILEQNDKVNKQS